MAGLTVPPAGWYPDRNETNVVRWWDGQQWTDQTQSTAPAAAAFDQPVSAAAFGFATPTPDATTGAATPTPVTWAAPASAAPAAAAVTPAAVTVTAAAAASPVPGWYPDNRDASLLRWWDGTQWTTHTSPAAPLSQSTLGSGPYGAGTQPLSSASNTMATLAMVLSIGSFVGLIFWPFLLLALPGIIVGIVAVRRARMFAPSARRRGQAIAGIVLGAVSVVATILLTVAALLVYEQVHRTDFSQTGTQQSSPQTNGGTVTDDS